MTGPMGRLKARMMEKRASPEELKAQAERFGRVAYFANGEFVGRAKGDDDWAKLDAATKSNWIAIGSAVANEVVELIKSKMR